MPKSLTKDCILPDIPQEGASNDVLVEYMAKMETALKDCNTDKQSIRLWQNQPPQQ